MISANFGENQTNNLGQVRKSRGFKLLKTAKNLDLYNLTFWYAFHLTWNQMLLLKCIIQKLLA